MAVDVDLYRVPAPGLGFPATRRRRSSDSFVTEQSPPVQFPPRDFCLSTLGMFELGLDPGDVPPLKSDRPDSGQVVCESVLRYASSRWFRAEGIEPGCTSVDSV